MLKFDLSGKSAVVTGSNGLLGQQHCKALKAVGAVVIGVDLHEANLAEDDHCDHFLTSDISNPEMIRETALAIEESVGRIDVLVNNAAINDSLEGASLNLEDSMFENYPFESWDQALKVNLTGVFLCCQAFGKHMLKHERGSIINIASTYGIVGPDQAIYRDENDQQIFYKGPSYSATKGGVISFTKFLASYWGDKGIRVNSLSPGGVENGQDMNFVKRYADRTCLKRMAQKDDYTGAIQFLASDASSYMTGANLVVDGGWTAT